MVSIDDSRNAFVADQKARSFESCEWLYQFPDILRSVGRCTEYNSGLSDLHDRIRKWILQEVKMHIPGGEFVPHAVWFDERVGWTVSTESEKCYLGKVLVSGCPKVSMGRMSYFSGPSLIRGNGNLSIGMFSCIAEGMCISTENENHPFAYPAVINWASNRRLCSDDRQMDISYNFESENSNEVSIGHDVWIGRNVRVQSGSKIGTGCVVAEGSLVRGELEPYGIYAGWPVKRKKDRFSKQQVERMMELAWWNWPWDKIHAEKSFFAERVSG